MNWPEHSWTSGLNRQIILEMASGQRFYAKGDDLYDLNASENLGWPVRYDTEREGLAKAVVGEDWPEAASSDPVNKVQVGYKIASAAGVGENGGMLDDEFEKRGEDPFAAAEALLNRLQEHDGDGEASTEFLYEAESEADATDNAENDTAETAILDPSSEGKRTRARRLMGRARRKLRDLPLLAAVKGRSGLERARNYYTDAEKGKRRKIVSGIIGALAVGGLAYLELKGGSVAQSAHQPSGGKEAIPPHHPQPGHVTSLHAHHSHSKQVTSLRKRGNPWTVSEHQLKAHGDTHPTNAAIEDYDKRMAALNRDIYHYNGTSANHLPVGTRLELPEVG